MQLEHPSFEDWRKRSLVPDSGPCAVSINMSGRCNLSCFMCAQSLLDEIPINIKMKNLEPFLENAHTLNMAGGEPLFFSKKSNPLTQDIFHQAVNNFSHLKLSIQTNGILLDQKMAEVILDRFHMVQFSVDTVDPKIFEKVRSKPLLDRLLNNIRTLAKMKRASGLRYCDPPLIDISTIVMQSTLDGIPDVARFVREVDAHRHSLLRLAIKFTPHFTMLLNEHYRKNGKGEEKAGEVFQRFSDTIIKESFIPERISGERVEKVRKEVKKIYNGTRIVIEDQVSLLGYADNNFGSLKPLPINGESVCSYPWTTAHIQENGDVFSCCANNAVFGNLGKDSFEEIWKGEAAREVRDSFIRGEMTGCSQRICPAPVNYFEKNDIYSKKLHRNLTKIYKNKKVSSILLLRTVLFFHAKLIAYTLMKCFPDARLSIITGPAGEEACKSWDSRINVITYPENRFMPEKFKAWWQGIATQKYRLAAAIYDDNRLSYYSNITRIMDDIEADSKLKIFTNGDILTNPQIPPAL